ncbi:YjcZ family sporulation protein [Evansella cellulosilytica]|uniref:YjcZ family sporulation protein n=1 Tax=Evansella cellulosilytica (strain ATCC 21833 / DSM 2522 / FERM P-1141 / JCM 9156 / N-4) TaxID=649639 RepID=E6TYS5_EVAC2|nr:YjcZ family sporulation protein [Evansella cellulosilytica]ADU31260.1 Conserved hypothetical protein Tiny-TM [Evansella cellulosilytica DSM 2522]
MSHYHGYDPAVAGYGYGYGAPVGCGYAPVAPVTTAAPATGGFATGFALVLVLFILLVIIGAAWAY